MQVNIAQFPEGAFNGFAGDFGEGHAVDGNLGFQNLFEVPGDRFTFAVTIGCEVEGVNVFEFAFEFGDFFLFIGVNHIVGVKIVVDIDRELADRALFQVFGQFGRLRQVTNMSHGRIHQKFVS